MQKPSERYTHTRNYGCRIREYLYKGLRMVTLENEIIKVSILIDKGTDIFEFIYKPQDIDAMWHSYNELKSPASYVPSTAQTHGPFADYYEGGWQELFPNIGDDCFYMGAPLGGHGEVCHTAWEYSIIKDQIDEISVKFWIRTTRMPYFLEKVMTLRTNDPFMEINEIVTNEGFQDLQFMWGHHPSFGPLFLDESCEIEMPKVCSARTNCAELGEYAVLPKDTTFTWPYVDGLDGQRWDVSKVPPPDSRIYQMYYLYDISEGQYKLKNKKRGITFEMRWDAEVFPYIWVWAPYGGSMDYPWFGRNYNLAIEPWSSIPHNLGKVAEEGKGIHIAAGDSIKTTLFAGIYGEEPCGIG